MLCAVCPWAFNASAEISIPLFLLMFWWSLILMYVATFKCEERLSTLYLTTLKKMKDIANYVKMLHEHWANSFLLNIFLDILINYILLSLVIRTMLIHYSVNCVKGRDISLSKDSWLFFVFHYTVWILNFEFRLVLTWVSTPRI